MIDNAVLAMRTIDYLRVRAAREGVRMLLKADDVQRYLDVGIVSALGIEWNEDGQLVRDAQEPEPGFLERWQASGQGSLN
jgi:hypothetical protein